MSPPSPTRLPWPGAWRDPAFWIATWGGSGLLPRAPGTWGTLAALPFGWLLLEFGGPQALLIGVLASLFAGVWASERYMAHTGAHDPGSVVIDEVAGMWLTLFAMPIGAAWTYWLAAFALFRLFDILKPWPISLIDRRAGGGWGVMLDDIVAGIYAAAVLWGVIYVF